MNITKEELKELFEQKLTETAQLILEAVDEKVKASEQRITAGFEIFTDEVRGMLKDVNDSNIDATNLSERVEATENILKTNVLPRLDILEKSV
jgi:hypothetical protein